MLHHLAFQFGELISGMRTYKPCGVNVASPAQPLVLPELDTGEEHLPQEPPPLALNMDNDGFDINVMLRCIPTEDQEVFA
jgi:hypothetical protein